MSEWLTFVKAYPVKNSIPYKQALKDASSSYKTRNEAPVEPVVAITKSTKPKRKYIKKVKSTIL